MYFEFESISGGASMSTDTSVTPIHGHGLSRRHRRLSSSTQSLRDVMDAENVLENITPSHCDLYLITRKKLSAIAGQTAAAKQSPDLRREVLLTSIHRTITSNKTSPSPPPLNTSAATSFSFNNEMSSIASTPDSPMITSTPATPTVSVTALRDDKLLLNTAESSTTQTYYSSVAGQHIPVTNCGQQYKYASQSTTTSTSTTTMANTANGVRMTNTSITTSTPSLIKKRNLCPNPIPSGDYEDEWKTTIKRVKVVHGLEGQDVSMDSLELDSGYCDTDLNDLTNNFHSLKTPFK